MVRRAVAEIDRAQAAQRARALAAQGLLMCHVLRADDQVLVAIRPISVADSNY